MRRVPGVRCRCRGRRDGPTKIHVKCGLPEPPLDPVRAAVVIPSVSSNVVEVDPSESRSRGCRVRRGTAQMSVLLPEGDVTGRLNHRSIAALAGKPQARTGCLEPPPIAQARERLDTVEAPAKSRESRGQSRFASRRKPIGS